MHENRDFAEREEERKTDIVQRDYQKLQEYQVHI